ncbi:ABC transporter permease [Streptosporangium sp. NPDC000239]|uniref:ABC transporter permease n=1 Tax=Streptosporangium jomthongense TaxID=1193683 RepID=A0ABV8EUC0_9ACTN
MFRFILRRTLQAVVTFVALTAILFAWLRSLPGGPLDALLGENASPQDRAKLVESLGLDAPLWTQYLRYLGRFWTGDLGVSTGVWRGAPVTEVLLTRAPATIELALCALVVGAVLGVAAGYWAATRRGVFDVAFLGFSVLGLAVPVFFTGFVLKYVFAVRAGWLPPSGRADLSGSIPTPTGLTLLDSLLAGSGAAFVESLRYLTLPTIALTIIPFAVIFRLTRASVAETLQQDFVRTANSKGLRNPTVAGRHVLRNSLLPVITVIGLQAGGLFAGAVLTETVFNYRGLGQSMALAFSTRDYAVLQALIMIAAVLYLVINIVVDIAYALCDPRVRTP